MPFNRAGIQGESSRSEADPQHCEDDTVNRARGAIPLALSARPYPRAELLL
jgi:hypothetical protein